jgi:hypothetical protein
LNNPAQEGGATISMLLPVIPGALKKVVKIETKVVKAAGNGVKIKKGVPINGAVRRFPLGFKDEEQFLKATEELEEALKKSGINDGTIGVRGSSVTGESLTKGTPFHAKSDIDIYVESKQLTDGFKTSGNIEGFVHPGKIFKKYPILEEWTVKWKAILNRDITPGAFVPGSLPNQPTIVVK